jgi:CBS domain-containing protein
MITTEKWLLDQTAADLMNSPDVRLTEKMPLRRAAEALVRAGVHGAAVVDDDGRCVGVLSASDLVRWALHQTGPVAVDPWTCSYREEMHGSNDEADPPGACPGPNDLFLEWQMVDFKALPTDDVRHYMTAAPVTVGPATSIGELARAMTDAGVHRVVVVDDQCRPIGVVSASELVEAVADSVHR